MGRVYVERLPEGQVYSCNSCGAHITRNKDVLCKSFHGRFGRAYLVNQAVNVTLGTKDERMLMTGLHTVCDVFCTRCHNPVGWTYLHAFEESQKYKEGKFTVEKMKLVKDGWK
eukprot:gb/GECG01006846.1/.p1 GENE.gb/GECG01006846.1/~~gb/GECG01006846.1/.p1  ORF type:complete len:113 (+),score=6.28 gb/GECG01006846.1/:1-339(+)